MPRLYEKQIGTHTLRSHHSISDNLSRLVPPTLQYMLANNLDEIYVADLIAEIGEPWASTKGGRQGMLQSAIRGGVQIENWVLFIGRAPVTYKYQKSVMVVRRRGTLESVVVAEDPLAIIPNPELLDTAAAQADAKVYAASAARMTALEDLVHDLQKLLDETFEEIERRIDNLEAKSERAA